MIALYLRLSMADGDLGKDGKDESNSIENQRAILQDFIERRDDVSGEVIEYVDDGYSGTNFDRPAFKSMVNDMKKGQIDTMLTKDLSRLGRNYIEVGDYMEQIFPLLGVRYIAVNSNYDSNDYIGNTIGLEMSVMNLVNSLYSKDLSKKYRTAMETKWSSGHATSGRTPFGYDRHPSIKGKWIIEPVAAEIVRIIYDMVNEGKTMREIIDCLNENHVMTPGQYRERYGYQRRVRRKVSDEEWLWDSHMMYRILGNYEYTGALVQSKMKTIAVGSGSRRTVPRESRFITEGHHEPLVTKEEFEKGRALFKSIKKGGIVNIRDYPLADIIYCGNCGLRMDFPTTAVETYVKCRHKKLVGKASGCTDTHYPTDKIDYFVRRALFRQIELLEKLQDELVCDKAIDGGTSDLIKNLEKQIEAKKVDKTRAYESYASGLISRDDFIKKRDLIKSEVDGLISRMDAINEPVESRKNLMQEADDYLRMASNLLTKEGLTKQAVEAFLERIDIYDEEHIEISFKFDDVIEKLIQERRRSRDM